MWHPAFTCVIYDYGRRFYAKDFVVSPPIYECVFRAKTQDAEPQTPRIDDRFVHGTIVIVNRYSEFSDRRSKIKIINGSLERRMYLENKIMIIPETRTKTKIFENILNLKRLKYWLIKKKKFTIRMESYNKQKYDIKTIINRIK